MKKSDYLILIYTTIRKHPFRTMVEDVVFPELRLVMEHIKRNGMFLGQYESGGSWVSPQGVIGFKWTKKSIKSRRRYKGDYLDKSSIPSI